MVSKRWKILPDDEREIWEEMARQDKARYEMEKAMYTGPWKVPATRKRMVKDPNAPKRPMSAFLAFSNSNRRSLRDQHRLSTNAEVSQLLAQIWKNTSDEDRSEYVAEEYRLRQQYKLDMAAYKKQADHEVQSQRQEREDKALQAIREGKTPQSVSSEYEASASPSSS